MAQPTPPRSNRAGLGGSTAVRGGVLVVGAIFIGALLMWKGGGGTVVASDGDRIAATTTTVASSGSTTVATTPSAATPPAQLKIIAANGTSLKGLAGRVKTQLAGTGYTSVTATDTSSPVTSSLVYYAVGAEADGKAVAKAAGFSADRVAQLPTGTALPLKSVGDAKVVILLGPDTPGAGGTATTTTAPRAATTTTVKK